MSKEINSSFRWKCADRRFKIQQKPTPDNQYWNPLVDLQWADCKWDKSFNYGPEDLQCIVQYCDNPIDDPNASHNYNYNWNGNLIPINSQISYPCKNGHKIEQNTNKKSQAAGSTSVLCKNGTLRK